MAKKRLKPQAEPSEPRGLLIQLPANERGLSIDQVQRFEKARAELLSPRLALTEEQKDTRAQIMAHVENAPKALAEKEWRETALAETVALAQARGEEVERSTVIRVNSRDGLKSLHDLGKLTREQYEEGVEYRRAMEARSGDVGSQLGNEGGGGSAHNNDLYVFNRIERARKLKRLGDIDRAIVTRCISQPWTLQIVRFVAGEGGALSAFGRGRIFDRHLESLRRGLDIAMTVPRPEAPKPNRNG